jgi:hypothetical protein
MPAKRKYVRKPKPTAEKKTRQKQKQNQRVSVNVKVGGSGGGGSGYMPAPVVHMPQQPDYLPLLMGLYQQHKPPEHAPLVATAPIQPLTQQHVPVQPVQPVPLAPPPTRSMLSGFVPYSNPYSNPSLNSATNQSLNSVNSAHTGIHPHIPSYISHIPSHKSHIYDDETMSVLTDDFPVQTPRHSPQPSFFSAVPSAGTYSTFLDEPSVSSVPSVPSAAPSHSSRLLIQDLFGAIPSAGDYSDISIPIPKLQRAESLASYGASLSKKYSDLVQAEKLESIVSSPAFVESPKESSQQMVVRPEQHVAIKSEPTRGEMTLKKPRNREDDIFRDLLGVMNEMFIPGYSKDKEILSSQFIKINKILGEMGEAPIPHRKGEKKDETKMKDDTKPYRIRMLKLNAVKTILEGVLDREIVRRAGKQGINKALDSFK